MGAVQKDCWYLVALIFLPFLKVAAQDKEVPTVRLEEGMVLGCVCPWNGNLTQVSWTKVSDPTPLVVFHPQIGMAPSRHYVDRIEFLKRTPKDGSISLRNVTHQDIGTYRCSIQMFPEGSWTTTVRVEDLDEPPEEEEDDDDDSSSRSELPSTTRAVRADSTLHATENDNVTLRCERRRGGTVHAVTVEKMAGGEPWSLVGECRRAKRPPPPGGEERLGLLCTDDLDVSVQLAGVAQRDGGLYRCNFSTDGGVHSTTVLLTVVPAGGVSLSVYMMYVYIGASAAAFVLLIIIVVILAVRNRRQRRRVEYRVKLHQAQRPKKNNKKSPDYVNLQTARSYKSDRQHPR
ncbi:CD226 antigen isoform X3 [Nelusetta ayraudi]|uniref:CD226 antigen isoform X3 n=1 Tax=Nelusetta ayraudi TaxID=303726 RepID=UPI003F71F6FD